MEYHLRSRRKHVNCHVGGLEVTTHAIITKENSGLPCRWLRRYQTSHALSAKSGLPGRWFRRHIIKEEKALDCELPCRWLRSITAHIFDIKLCELPCRWLRDLIHFL